MKTPKPKKFRYYVLIISICFIALILCLSITSRNIIYVGYEYIFKMNHFSAGDNIYLKDFRKKKDGPIKQLIGLERLIRPINKQDVDNMLISNEEKVKLKATLNPLLKTYLINTNSTITYHNSDEPVATYIKHCFLLSKAESSNHYVWVNEFAIAPMASNLTIDDQENYHLPAGYTWADTTYYIGPIFTLKR